MKIDGKEFKSYLLDNEYTIKRRFAILDNIIPEFIYIEKNIDAEDITKNEYKTINLIKKIQDSDINSLDKIKDLNDKYFYLSLLDLMCLWCTVKYKGKLPSGNNIDFLIFLSYIEKNNLRSDYIENEIPYFLKKVNDKKKYIQEILKYELNILKEFDDYKGVDSTDLEVIKTKKEYVYTVNIDSCTFFDSIKLSNDIPFATLKDFYKIYKGFKPLTKWIFLNDDLNVDKNSLQQNKEQKDIITLKVSNVKNTPLMKENEFNILDELDMENYEKESEEQEKSIQSLKEEVYNNVYITFKSSWDEYLEEKLKKEKIESREKQRLKLLQIAMDKEEKQKEEKIGDKRVNKEENKGGLVTIKRKGFKYTEESEEEKKKKEKLKKEKEENEKKILEEEKELEKRRIEIELEETIKQKRKEYKMYILIETNVSDKETQLNDEGILQRVLSCFTAPVKLLKKGVEKQIQSEFYIPQQLVDFPILKDMFFNNNLFKKFLQLDERLSIYKYKKNMYFYYIPDINEAKTRYIACSLIQKKVEKTDIKLMAKNSKLSVGSNYLQLKILRCNNYKESEKFKDIICKYIGCYNKLKDKIINEYKEILKNSKSYKIEKLLEQEKQFKEQKRYVRKKQLLKDIDPNQFIPGYARICEKKYAPKVLNENEIEKYYGENAKEKDIDKRKHIMLYPKNPEDGTQYYYSCMDNKNNHLYPGLQKNYLDNFDKFPVVPCCFVSDQSVKIDSPYELYYGDRNMTFEQMKEYFIEKESSDTASHIITTQKLLPSGRFGVLPKDIISFLHSIDPDNQYYRKGSIRSVDSVLDALLYARKSDYEEYSFNEKIEYIEKIKDKMIDILKENNINYLQESYNVNMLQIIRDKSYINPHIFYPVLEHIFKCNIILFTRNIQHPNGILSCPYFDKEYLKFKSDNKQKFVIIYEHMGTETDNAKYPQCEIIFNYDKNTIYPTFKYDDFIENINNSLYQMYPVKIYNSIDKIFKKYEIQKYGIDEFGKTIYLHLKHNKSIHIITNPLPNLDLDIPQTIISFSKFNKFNDIKLAYEFGQVENINLTSYVKNGIFYGFQGEKDYITFYIPTIPTKTSGNVPDNSIDFPIVDVKNNEILINKLDIYNEYKNISRLLVEYFYYLFSVDYNLYKPDIINDNYIENFIRRNILIQNKVDYKDLLNNGRIFNIDILKKTTKNETIYQLPLENKLILSKLVYNLKLKLDREHLKLFNYNNLQYIPSSYSEVDDFKMSIENNNIVIKGKYSMIQWIKATKNNYNVYDFVQLPRISVYHEINNILENDQKNNLLLLVFVSKWSKPCKNIQNKLYSTKTKKLIFDKYKNEMTIIYIDIDNHKAFSDYFTIKTLPTFIFCNLDHSNNIMKIISRIEGDVKMFKNLKLLNTEIKNILKDIDKDSLTNVLDKAKNDQELDIDIDKVLEDIIENIDIEEGFISSDEDSESNEKEKKLKFDIDDFKEISKDISLQLSEKEENKEKEIVKTTVKRKKK